MIFAWGLLLLTLHHVSFAAVPNVEPEFLDMLRETGQHEAFAKFLGVDPSLVHPAEGRSEEDIVLTTVSHLGDILLTPEQEEHARQGVDFNRYSSSKWPKNEIPYTITRSDFSTSQKKRIESAITALNAQTKKLKVVPRTNQKDYVAIINGKGCYSYLGKTGGQQVLSLQRNGCLRTGTIQHEFIHAAGFMHEQCRPDRDDYVKVLFENISPEWRSQYEKSSASDFGIQGPYDPYSVMHYPMQGDNGKPAFEFKDKSVNTALVGQRNGPTKTDIQKIDVLYP